MFFELVNLSTRRQDNLKDLTYKAYTVLVKNKRTARLFKHFIKNKKRDEKEKKITQTNYIFEKCCFLLILKSLKKKFGEFYFTLKIHQKKNSKNKLRIFWEKK